MKGITRKEEIVKTAAKLFKEKGYSAVTMRDLATAMGIKAASLYNHINSKQEILKEMREIGRPWQTRSMHRVARDNFG